MLDLSDELNALAERVIGAAIAVHRELGAGFKEATYHKALAIEFEHRGIRYEHEYPVRLHYRGQAIGDGSIDFLVEEQLVLELKATEHNEREYRRQVVCYLKATDLQLGLLINFEVGLLKDGVSRIIHSK